MAGTHSRYHKATIDVISDFTSDISQKAASYILQLDHDQQASLEQLGMLSPVNTSSSSPCSEEAGTKDFAISSSDQAASPSDCAIRVRARHTHFQNKRAIQASKKQAVLKQQEWQQRCKLANAIRDNGDDNMQLDIHPEHHLSTATLSPDLLKSQQEEHLLQQAINANLLNQALALKADDLYGHIK